MQMKKNHLPKKSLKRVSFAFGQKNILFHSNPKKNMDFIYLNPAVAKIILSKSSKEVLIQNGKKLKQLSIKTEPQTNERAMFVNLYKFCQELYIEKYIVRK